MDVLTAEQRRLNMSRIRGGDTKPEMLIRRGLHARGYRYRLHQRDLPGRPDLVLPKHRAVIFVHGCFWHGHGCPMFKMPATRQAFWRAKIEATRARDATAHAALGMAGWRILTVWECALRGPARHSPGEVFSVIESFLMSSDRELEVEGAWRASSRCGSPLGLRPRE